MFVLSHAVPRLTLGTWPTPLQRAARLSEALGAPIYIKRDDMTGIGGGGNKVRKLEFQLAQAVASIATHVITTGSVQSNHAHLTAAASRRLGLSPVLVLSGNRPELSNGNLLLDTLLDAELRFVTPVPGRPPLDTIVPAMEAAALEILGKGGRPFIIPEGGTDPLGSVGYVLAVEEIAVQLQEVTPAYGRAAVIVATGTCGTHAGLAAGAKLLDLPIDVIGMSISGTTSIKITKTAHVATQTLHLLGARRELSEAEVRIRDEYRGLGYGHASREGTEAIRLVARTEGIFLDPIYTGKAMAGLIDMAQKGELAGYDAVIFLHSGGLPLLFVPESNTIGG